MSIGVRTSSMPKSAITAPRSAPAARRTICLVRTWDQIAEAQGCHHRRDCRLPEANIVGPNYALASGPSGRPGWSPRQCGCKFAGADTPEASGGAADAIGQDGAAGRCRFALSPFGPRSIEPSNGPLAQPAKQVAPIARSAQQSAPPPPAAPPAADQTAKQSRPDQPVRQPAVEPACQPPTPVQSAQLPAPDQSTIGQVQLGTLLPTKPKPKQAGARPRRRPPTSSPGTSRV